MIFPEYLPVHLLGLSRVSEELIGNHIYVLSLLVSGNLGHLLVPFPVALEVVASPQVVPWFLLNPPVGSGLYSLTISNVVGIDVFLSPQSLWLPSCGWGLFSLVCRGVTLPCFSFDPNTKNSFGNYIYQSIYL